LHGAAQSDFGLRPATAPSATPADHRGHCSDVGPPRPISAEITETTRHTSWFPFQGPLSGRWSDNRFESKLTLEATGRASRLYPRRSNTSRETSTIAMDKGFEPQKPPPASSHDGCLSSPIGCGSSGSSWILGDPLTSVVQVAASRSKALRHTLILPSMQATVSPPIQISLPTWATWTRPARPSAVPWLAM
jgi:hypothetical protein